MREVASKAPSGTGDYLSIKEAADFARVSVYTIRRWVKRGAVTKHEAGTQILVKRGELEQLLRWEPGDTIEARVRRRFGPDDLKRSPEERARRFLGLAALTRLFCLTSMQTTALPCARSSIVRQVSWLGAHRSPTCSGDADQLATAGDPAHRLLGVVEHGREVLLRGVHRVRRQHDADRLVALLCGLEADAKA
jgi:excisionase family DNA binding protein